MSAKPRSSVALFLDFDGTLVEFADHPESVIVPSELLALLRNLFSPLDGALAIVSGRSIKSVDSLLNLPFIPIAGGHGAEWRLDGTVHEEVLKSDEFATAMFSLQQFAQARGLLFENKAHSVALHFRQNPDLKKAVDQFIANEIEPLRELRVIYGNCVREIQPKGMDKGIAVERFMSLTPFAGRVPIYIGDDTTDEDAFKWVNANQGVSYKVGTGVTAAQHRLASVDHVRQFLADFLARLS